MNNEENEKDKPNYYAIIPANVRYDDNLKPMEKLLYGEISALSNKEGISWASNNYFAKLYKLTPQAISKYINNLKECGYITVDIIYKPNSKEIEKRIIGINNQLIGINKRLIGVSTYDEGGYQHTIKDNNTSINNTSNNINNTSSYIDASQKQNQLITFLQENGFNLAPIQYETVLSWLDYDLDLIKYVVKNALNDNKANIKYIDRVLFNLSKKNIKTVKQAEDDARQFTEQKQKQREERKQNGGYHYMSETEKANKEREDFDAMLDRVFGKDEEE